MYDENSVQQRPGYEVGTKETFNERLQKYRVDFRLMLNSRSDRPKPCWINANGIESFTLNTILKDCDGNVSHFKSQLRVFKLVNNDKNHEHDLKFVSNIRFLINSLFSS
ncbi:unnamed protein product [Ambrosiozyma monospora]|uniref:Unnamed protein product n=1 Tax=Ambrosiozyma monospora TaxID=43982 RepID=A0ACB5TCG2_AMBMO|nr:unnamed protein product [Ambrosiozyma monospora]